MKKCLSLLAFLAFTGCSFNVALLAPPGPIEEVIIKEGESKDKVLILEVDGIISAASKSGLLSHYESPVASLKERLRRAKTDEKIKAIVLRVNSPGGAVTASDIMYEELKRFRKDSGIPIVACFMDVAASGGYYISMSADKIICHPTCLTGSIGVIAQLATIDKMLEKLGIEPVTIKSGKHKDIGTPFRLPTDEEKDIMQKLVMSMYNRFVDIVAAGRKMPRERVIKFADGRVYDSAEAKELGLVDDIGYLDDAIAIAEQLGGSKHAQVVMYQRPGDYKTNIYSAEARSWDTVLADRLMQNLGARFYYLWIPGR